MGKSIEKNEEERNKNNKEITNIRRAIRNRKNKNEIYDDLSLRLMESKNFIIHYEEDIFIFKNRIVEFETLRNNKNVKIKSINQNIKLLKKNIVRCNICRIDTHRASYSRRLKSKKHFENIAQNKVIITKKKPIEEVIEVADIDKNDETMKINIILLIKFQKLLMISI